MKNNLLYIILVISAVTTSCFKDDEPIVAHFGKVTTIKNQIEQYQSYYDFETDSVSGSFSSDSWTLGFGCNENDMLISTNSGDNWFIYNTHQSDLNASVNFPENKIWNYDLQSFFPSFTAISNWGSVANSDTTFAGTVFFLGRYTGSSFSDIYRIKILKADKRRYVFCYRSENSFDPTDTITVLKVPSRNFVFFSFTDFSVKGLEPAKTAYDIVFGPYYDTVTQIGVTAPYLVRGVLLNSNTYAAIDSLKDFGLVDSVEALKTDFSKKRNFIGYNWKDVSIDQSASSASYAVRSDFNYIVKTQEGNYYKFRFLSYTINGENGYPSFQIEKLK
jgi:hypothetical protein